jgi:hypothetical protein
MLAETTRATEAADSKGPAECDRSPAVAECGCCGISDAGYIGECEQ